MKNCPTCGRSLKTRTNQFGDEICPNHKMAAAWDKSGKPSESVSADLRPEYNPAAAYTHEITCPMSGQPVN